jgi:hypothetical protein
MGDGRWEMGDGRILDFGYFGYAQYKFWILDFAEVSSVYVSPRRILD